MKPRLLICDIDGVVCDSSSRQAKYSDLDALKRGDHNAFRISMNAYNSTTEGDITIDRGVMLLNHLCSAYAIDRTVFLTARGEIGRPTTLAWLRREVRAHVSSDDLIMREEQPEIRPGVWWEPGMPNFSSVEQKRTETLKLMKDFEVYLALDDKPDIIAMYQEIEVNALMVCWSNIDCLTLVGDARSPLGTSSIK